MVIFSGTSGTYDEDGSKLNTDPLFVDAVKADYHLSAASPLIEAGTNTGAPPDDFEGDVRPFDGDEDATAIADIGADEFNIVAVTGVRTLPSYAGTGMDIDVTITIDVDEAKVPNGLIINEYIPSGWTLVSATPVQNSYDSSTGEIGWLFFGSNVKDRTISLYPSCAIN